MSLSLLVKPLIIGFLLGLLAMGIARLAATERPADRTVLSATRIA
jgi:hypothetical protein